MLMTQDGGQQTNFQLIQEEKQLKQKTFENLIDGKLDVKPASNQTIHHFFKLVQLRHCLEAFDFFAKHWVPYSRKVEKG